MGMVKEEKTVWAQGSLSSPLVPAQSPAYGTTLYCCPQALPSPGSQKQLLTLEAYP